MSIRLTLTAALVILPPTAVYAQPGTGAPFGARDARTCTVPAPKSGGPSPALIARSFICHTEKQWTGAASGTPQLTLVDQVNVEVAVGHRYRCEFNCPTDVDFNKLSYPIRGSFVETHCVTPAAAQGMGHPATANCQSLPTPNATGECYTTTFGDLVCYMYNRNLSFRDWGPWGPPPRS